MKSLRYGLFFIAYLSCVSFFYLYWDIPIANFFHQLTLSPEVDTAVQFLNAFGLAAFYLIGFPILAIFFLTVLKEKKIARILVFLWLCILLSSILCDALKTILGRARPVEFFTSHIYGFYGFRFSNHFWSFPSGHTTVIAALMVGLSYLKPRWSFIFISLALLVSSMRLVLLQHYFSDVFSAFCLALACVHFLHAFYLKNGYNFPKF